MNGWTEGETGIWWKDYAGGALRAFIRLSHSEREWEHWLEVNTDDGKLTLDKGPEQSAKLSVAMAYCDREANAVLTAVLRGMEKECAVTRQQAGEDAACSSRTDGV